MRITQAPKWKSMLRIELERFFELPIMQAPKRNSKRHKKMGTISIFPRPISAPRRVRATRHGAVTSARASMMGRSYRLSEVGAKENSGFCDFSAKSGRFARDATKH